MQITNKLDENSDLVASRLNSYYGRIINSGAKRANCLLVLRIKSNAFFCNAFLLYHVPTLFISITVMYQVPRTTLRTRFGGKFGADVRARLTAAEEGKLADFATIRAAMGYEFGKNQFLNYAGALAKK